MLREFFRFLVHNKPIFTPIIRYNASNIGSLMGVNELKREVPIVVSLTSNEKNFSGLELTLYSLCKQEVCPDRIIVWLSDEFELSDLPYSLTRFIKNGVEFRFVKDKDSYTDFIYALREFGNSIIVLAKDDVYYPKNWLKKLYHSYISKPKDIHVHLANRVKYGNKKVYPYKQWDNYIGEENASYRNFSIASGGILFPPHCFSNEIFREDIYKKKVKAEPEVWYWVMALVSDRKIRVVKNHISNFSSTSFIRKLNQVFNNSNQTSLIDLQIEKLMTYYKNNLIQKLNEK